MTVALLLAGLAGVVLLAAGVWLETRQAPNRVTHEDDPA